MPKRYVEGKSGSRVKPPRCGVSLSCSPLWRRCRHDCSLGNVGPWRRFYDDPERAWTGLDPADGLGSGARPAGGLGRGLRSVGPVAAPQGRCGGYVRQSWGTGGGDSPSAGPGPLRACPGSSPDRRVHPPGHAPSHSRSISGSQNGIALASRPAASGARAGLADLSDASGISSHNWRGTRHTRHRRSQVNQLTSKSNHQGAGCRPACSPALPHYPSPGRPAEHRGGEP